MKLTLAILIVLVVAAGVLLGAGAARGAAADSTEQRRTSLVALPFAYYTPETKFAFGGGGVYSFRPRDSAGFDRPSSVRLAATYTQLNQMILGLMPEIYLKGGRYYFSAFYGYYKFPNKFWGIGGGTPDDAEEHYEQNDFESYTNVQRLVAPGLFVGIRGQFQHVNVKKPDVDGMLARREILGTRGGAASGIGVVVSYDTRNHVYQPSSGFNNQLFAVFFGKLTGSDFAFTLLSVDLRYYVPVFGSHVVAFQTYDTVILGEAPFQMLSLLGGSYSMRGYYKGRYRDRNMLSLQAEYRAPLFWRIGAVAFAGAGDVSGELADFRVDRLKPSVGVGLRFMFDARERINARLDFGFGKDDNSGIYAMVLEAF